MPIAFLAVAAWSWRASLIGAIVSLVVRLAANLGLVVLVLFAGLRVTALLRPAVDWLAARGVPRLAVAWLGLLSLLTGAVALIWGLARRALVELQAVRFGVGTGLEELRDLVVQATGSPLARVNAATQRVIDQLTGGPGQDGLPIPVLQGANAVVAVLAAAGLTLFSAFWLLYDGSRVWQYVVRLFPRPYRAATDGAGRRAWTTLGGYLRAASRCPAPSASHCSCSTSRSRSPLPC